MTNPAQAPADAVHLPVSLLDPCLLNPRKSYAPGKIEELATSIRSVGVLQPLTARPKAGGRYEVIIGFRRYLAAKLAGLATVPAIVRDLSDADALEIMLAENLLREDLPPVDEADGFKVLNQESGWDPTEIAAHTGKDLTYVTERLRLADCPKETKTAIRERRLTLHHALLLVRLGDAEVIAEATRACLRGRGDSKPLTVAETRQLLEQRYLLRLTAAPFPVDQPLAGAAACLECPKRASAQGALFPNSEALTRDDRCLDRLCFEGKRDAHFAAVRDAAKADGTQVLTEAEARARFGLKPSDPIGTDLTGPCYELELTGIPYTQALGELYVQHCRAGCPHFALIQPSARASALTPTCFSTSCRADLLKRANPTAAARRATKRREQKSGPGPPKRATGPHGAADSPAKRTSRAAIAREHRNRFLRAALQAPLTHAPAMLTRLALAFILSHEAARRSRDGVYAREDLLAAWGVPLKERAWEDDPEWRRARRMPDTVLVERLAQALLATVDHLSPEILPDIAPTLGVNIAQDFAVDEPYLKTRTKAELLDLAEELDLADADTRKGWERRLKRPEMIQAILERWKPGQVPNEIREVSASEFAEEPGEPPTAPRSNC